MKINSNIAESVHFEDLLIASKRSEINPATVSLNTKFTKNIELKIPFISAADENVTMAEMAIVMAKLGGVGIINSNIPVAEQIKEIEKIKAVQLSAEETSKASVDKEGKLLAVAGVKFNSAVHDNVKALAEANVGVIMLENSNLNIKEVAHVVEKARINFPDLQMVVGNAYSSDDVRILVESGAEGIKIGNRKQIVEQLGVDVLNLRNILDIIGEAQVAQLPVTFDDNILTTASIAKIIALGCNSVVIRDILAGAKEAPGKIIEEAGVSFKLAKNKYRYKGEVENIIRPLINNLKLSISYTGNADIKTFIDEVELNKSL